MGSLGFLRERVEVLVENSGGHVARIEQVPSRPPVGARVFIALRERGAGSLEHHVVGGADGPLEAPAGECFPGEDMHIAAELFG